MIFNIRQYGIHILSISRQSDSRYIMIQKKKNNSTKSVTDYHMNKQKYNL